MKVTRVFLVAMIGLGVGCGGSGTETLNLEDGAPGQISFFPDATGTGGDDASLSGTQVGDGGGTPVPDGAPQDANATAAQDGGDNTCDAACPAPSCGAWSTCAGANECSTSGTQTRSCVAHLCKNGACVDQPATMDTQSCTNTTEGKACMGSGVTCGAWGTCTYADATCSNSGSQSRSCTQMQCKSGTCSSVAAPSETQSCGSRNTNGTACPGGRSCGGWGGCGCGSGCSGSQSRSCWSYRCESGSCVNVGADGQSTSQGCNCGSGKSCSGSCGGATCDGSGHCVDCGGNACCNGTCCSSGYGCAYYGGGSSLICVDYCPDNVTQCPQPETCNCAYNGSSISCSGCN